MKAKEFVVKKIKELNIQFPYFLFKYSFEELSHSHYIETIPHSQFNGDIKFIEAQKELYLEFIENFPYDSLTIHGEENDFIFDDVELFPGTAYNIQGADIKEYEVLLFTDYWYKLPEQLEINIYLKRKGHYYFNYINKSPDLKSITTDKNSLDNLEELLEVISNVGENNYALAA